MTPIHALWASALLVLGGATATAEAPGPVTELSITPMASQTSVRIAVDGEVEFREFTMEGPHRLVVDLMGARHSLPRDNFADVNRGGIRAVRTSQYATDIVRVVLVLERQVGYAVVQEPGGLRINLENPAGTFAPWSSGITAPRASTMPLDGRAGWLLGPGAVLFALGPLFGPAQVVVRSVGITALAAGHLWLGLVL